MALSGNQATRTRNRRGKRAWLAHYEPEVSRTPAIPDLTFDRLFALTASDHPTGIATIFFGQKLTYSRLSEQVDHFAAGLHSMGLRPGDRIAILLPNCPQFIIALLGSLRAGAVAMPLDPAYSTANLHDLFNDGSVETVVTLSNVAPKVREAIPGTPVRHLIITRLQDYLSPLMGLLLSAREKSESPNAELQAENTVRFIDLITTNPADYTPPNSDPDNPALILYTGGTTGTPKGVVLAHRQMVANACQINAWVWDARPEKHDIFLAAVPFYHSFDLTAALSLSIACAGAIVLLPRFTVKDALRAITRFKVSVFPGVPAIFAAISDHPLSPRYDLRSLRVCISEGETLPLEVTEAFEGMTGARLVESYGLTETTAITHCNPIYGERRPGSIGLPLPLTDARIIDAQSGAALPVGEVGELAVKGPQIMSGYWNRNDETQAAIRNGWLYTGDVAWRDADGYFYIVDRKKNLILAEGYSIFPREIEDILKRHEKIHDALVIGVPDKHGGITLKAYIVLKPDIVATEPELRRFAVDHLPANKVSVQIEFRESLPKNVTGKHLHRELTEEVARAGE